MVVQSTAQPIRATPQVRQLNLFCLVAKLPRPLYSCLCRYKHHFLTSQASPRTHAAQTFWGNSQNWPEPIKPGHHCDRSTRADPGYALGTARGIVTLCSWAICGFLVCLLTHPAHSGQEIYRVSFETKPAHPDPAPKYPPDQLSMVWATAEYGLSNP
jgi:hypothetical protein